MFSKELNRNSAVCPPYGGNRLLCFAQRISANISVSQYHWHQEVTWAMYHHEHFTWLTRSGYILPCSIILMRIGTSTKLRILLHKVRTWKRWRTRRTKFAKKFWAWVILSGGTKIEQQMEQNSYEFLDFRSTAAPQKPRRCRNCNVFDYLVMVFGGTKIEQKLKKNIERTNVF